MAGKRINEITPTISLTSGAIIPVVEGSQLKLCTIGNAFGYIKKIVYKDEFSETKTYAAGEVVVKDSVFYKFKSSKSAGPWNSSIVEVTNLIKDLGKNETSTITITIGSSDSLMDVEDAVVTVDSKTYNTPSTGIVTATVHKDSVITISFNDVEGYYKPNPLTMKALKSSTNLSFTYEKQPVSEGGDE